MTTTRRHFLRACLGASLAAWGGSAVWADDAPATLTVTRDASDRPIPSDFMGLSYEASLLSDAGYFRADNHALLGLLARLGGSGVIRVGGNSSDHAVWRASGDATPVPPKQHVLTPTDIERLGEFVKATGWKLIYGLNLGTGVPADAAQEAAAVSATLGSSLVAFQIGNEPNLYGHNGLRPKTYTVQDYLTEWQTFADAVRGRVANAPLAGPDAAGNGSWTTAMAWQNANQLVLLSQHYYTEGPGKSPKSTIARMLHSQGHLSGLLRSLQAASRQAHLPYRITEANSCYGGGRYGVSNTLAAAFWALDFQFQLAQHKAAGVNFHGGPHGAYTPIIRSSDGTYTPQPVYYGMLMFALASRGQVARATLLGAGPGVTAYAVHDDARLWVTVINTDAVQDVRLSVDCGGHYAQGTALRLTGPALDATTGITFGGVAVGGDGAWAATTSEPVMLQNGRFTLSVPAASAVTVTLT